ncbi:NigD-like protein [Bacteroides heparinolyticus]|uniref:NigD-like protein n=2 Tax=Prevotella heparinolytica TaxID=28113 RepID=UPI0023F353FE|nr:NigD-like protein [Bacteroides heparinolyticus]
MKEKHKKIMAAWMLLFLFIPALQSCMNDSDMTDQHNLGNDGGASLLAIGTVKVIEGKEYYFALDEGSKLYPGDTTYIHNYVIVDGQRAFVNFSKLSETIKGYHYNGKIHRIENILTKDIYFMPAAKADSIGDDRINITDLWIAGNYLNIKYQFYRSNHTNKHMLSLIVNEVSTDEKEKSDYVNVEFRHNAYKDNQQILASGLVSFKLDKISGLLKGKKGLNIRINSLYDGERFRTINY